MTALPLYPAQLLSAPRLPLGDTDRPGRTLAALVAFVVVFGAMYGAVMGSFGGGRPLQMLYSAIKVPMLLLVTFALAVPSYFVLNTLLGARRDFADAIRALAATQAGLTIILASLAPFVCVWHASTEAYRPAILFNGLMFAIASLSSQRLLRRFYEPLVARNPRHRTLLRVWLVTYIFVGIQMGWVLRPFVGDPSKPTRFFRQGAWGNAYVEVARIIWSVVGG